MENQQKVFIYNWNDAKIDNKYGEKFSLLFFKKIVTGESFEKKN